MPTLISKETLLELQSVLAIAFCLGITLIAFVRPRLALSRPPLPPGPPGNPILGNSIPKAFAYRRFEKWTQEFGPVFSLRQGFKTVIVIGRLQAAVDILEKEGASTADRPRSIAAGEILSGGMRVMHVRPGERFKKMRRALHTHLPKSVHDCSLVLTRSARQHILDILKSPEKHQDHAKKCSTSVVMALAYSKHIESDDDPVVKALFRCVRRVGSHLRPGLWKVDTFPFLKFVPGYLKELQEGFAEELALFTSQLNVVRQSIERGEEVPPSFGKYIIERQEDLGLSDNEAAYLAGGMFGAGSDTTASGISLSVLAAACYPQELERVRKELERVVGMERPPKLMDQDELPQTMAWVLETFRWRPVTAGGLLHKSTKDIIWNGYLIPNGATIIGNIWSIGRDPAYFPDPERFNPQRWLKEDGKLRDDLKSYPFGFGRRICPGQYLATASVFLNTALLFWSFRIKADPESPIDEWAFTESINAHPLPFKVIFEPRVNLADMISELL